MLHSIEQRLRIQIAYRTDPYFSFQVLYLNFGCKSKVQITNKIKLFIIKLAIWN